MPALEWGLRPEGRGTEDAKSGVFIRRRNFSSYKGKGLPGGLLATEVGAVEKPLDSSDEYELPNDCP